MYRFRRIHCVSVKHGDVRKNKSNRKTTHLNFKHGVRQVPSLQEACKMQRLHRVKKERPIGATCKQQVHRTGADNPSKKHGRVRISLESMSSSLAENVSKKRERRHTTATHQGTPNRTQRSENETLQKSKGIGEPDRATAHDLDNARV